MKRIIPIFAAAVLTFALSTDALAKRRSLERRHRVVQSGEQIIVVPAGSVAPVASEFVEESTPVGAGSNGVVRSSGAGIGEASTRSDVGSGRGGAGIVSSGTLAPSSVRSGTTTIITTAPGRGLPILPRTTTFTGTLGNGTSTPVGVAPGR